MERMNMNDKLYIIGNGFDLHHNLKTSYKNFRDCFAKKNQRLWKSLTDFYGDIGDDDMWWTSFEERLGKIDYQRLKNSYNGEALGSFKIEQFLKNDLPFYFGEWIKQVDDVVEPDATLEIDGESQYFSFNYTLLLEKTYGIDERQIWHIHNSKRDLCDGERPIVGPDATEEQLLSHYGEYSKTNQDVSSYYADDVGRGLIRSGKKVKDRVSLLSDEFSKRFSNIRHYVLMGFSLNEIDIPYINKIVEVNSSFSDADWILYAHGDKDKKILPATMQKFGVEKFIIEDW